MTFNAEDGLLEFAGLSGEQHTTGLYTANIGQDKTQVIGGNDDKKVLGNKFLDILNDLAASINGATSAVFGGIVQATIANSPANGVPEATALSVELALGGASITSQLATDPMTFGTLVGDVNITTGAGNLLVETSVGNAKLGSVSGITEIEGPVGIHLGGTTFGIAFGETIQTIFTALSGDVRVGFSGVPIPPSPGLLAALTANNLPGVLFSLLNKTV